MMHGPINIRLRRVFEQSVNSRAVTMLRYTRYNIVTLMAATAWLMSFGSCIACGFDSYAVLFKCPQRGKKFSVGTGGEIFSGDT